MTTYPEIPEAPITRAEVERLKRRSSEYNEALLLLNRAGYSGSEYTPGGGLVRAVEGALHATETMRRVKDKIIAKKDRVIDRLKASLGRENDTICKLRDKVERQVAKAQMINRWRDADAATIRRLRREIDKQVARAEVAEAAVRGPADV